MVYRYNDDVFNWSRFSVVTGQVTVQKVNNHTYSRTQWEIRSKTVPRMICSVASWYTCVSIAQFIHPPNFLFCFLANIFKNVLKTFNCCDKELKCAKHYNLFNVLVISCSGDGSARLTNQRPAEILTNDSIPPEILANGSTPPKEQWHSIDDLPIDWSLKSRARFTSPQVHRSLN